MADGAEGVRGRLRAFGARALVAGVALAGGLAVGSAFHVTPVQALTSCDMTTSHAVVHYQFGVPAAGQPAGISQVSLTAFPAGCNGSTVKMVMSGNSSGDTSVPASGDTVLSTADSTRDACTQAVLASPRVVSAGSIVLPLCAAGGPAGYVSVRELTLLTLFVNGAAQPAGAVAGIGTTVPSAGLADQVFNALFGLGLLLVVVGVCAVGVSALGRRAERGRG